MTQAPKKTRVRIRKPKPADAARDLWLGTLHGVLWKLRNGAPAAERIPIPNADRELTSILAARDRSGTRALELLRVRGPQRNADLLARGLSSPS